MKNQMVGVHEESFDSLKMKYRPIFYVGPLENFPRQSISSFFPLRITSHRRYWQMIRTFRNTKIIYQFSEDFFQRGIFEYI